MGFTIQALPAKQFNVALYVLYLIQQDSSFPVIESSFYAINFYHLLLNLESPCKSPVVKNIINENSVEFIFRPIRSHKNYQHRTLRKKNVPLSYTRARELFLDVVTAVGMERDEFSLHSLRSGGASATENAGVNDRLFKSHGRWRSESAKDGYVDGNIEALLTVSRMLGL